VVGLVTHAPKIRFSKHSLKQKMLNEVLNYLC